MTSSVSVATMTCPASFGNDIESTVRANLAAVRERIVASGGGDVRIVAVTKSFGADAVRAAVAVGLQDVGENYVDELALKREQLTSVPVTWHYLGALQTNKIARIAAVADIISGVSRTKEIDKLASVAPGATIDVQVDYTGASQRNGAAPEVVPELVDRAREAGLHVRGLMTVAPPEAHLAERAFGALRELAERVGVGERSMGMSDDFELACRHGSTELRLGRILFGPRLTTGRLA